MCVGRQCRRTEPFTCGIRHWLQVGSGRIELNCRTPCWTHHAEMTERQPAAPRSLEFAVASGHVTRWLPSYSHSTHTYQQQFGAGVRYSGHRSEQDRPGPCHCGIYCLMLIWTLHMDPSQGTKTTCVLGWVVHGAVRTWLHPGLGVRESLPRKLWRTGRWCYSRTGKDVPGRWNSRC